MSRREIVVLTDDLDGTDVDVQTVAFAFNGVSYRIDLSPANHTRLATALAPFIAAARRQQSPTPRAAAGSRDLNRRVRDWAQTNGLQVSARGRVPASVTEAYHAAGLR